MGWVGMGGCMLERSIPLSPLFPSEVKPRPTQANQTVVQFGLLCMSLPSLLAHMEYSWALQPGS